MTGLYRASENWQMEANKMRQAGMSLPASPSQARAEAANIAAAVSNRTLAASMNRQRLAGYRKHGSDMQIAMPKIRQPLGTLADRGIPFNVEDDEELKEIRRWCRLFYSTHDLVPLLIDIYSKFPCVGMEFDSKDPLIKKFYEEMFLGDDLNYLEFLPDQFGREYFTVGEVTSMAHFNESLGVWAAEEILNPDMLRVSRSPFVQRDRVQLLVKEMVDNLRQGPMAQGSNMSITDETPSERLQRTEDYQELSRNYPELIEAAAQNDGLDVSEALISRIVNRNTPWARRGTPHLLRSFRTLMAEESLNAAQDAVADRLYSPMILATLGVPDLGDGEPWIPSQAELDELRDDMQTAFAADFRFIAHNFGLKIESVFGRESVPNLDNDFQRIDAKLLQAWGIGEALISGGTGGPYASSALNREFVTQMMVGFQNALRRHILKRSEIIAEAQGHYDYELKGGQRIPIYREIVFTDEETGKEYIRKVPKLLLPEVKFSTLNLRDEAQERAFIAQLKAMGVPVSDKKLAVNIDVEFDQELQRQAEETISKLVATAEAMKKVQDICDKANMPYPPELSQHLMATLQLRQGLDQTKMLDNQEEVSEIQTEVQVEQLELQKMQLDQAMAGMAPGMGPMGPGGAPPPGGGGPVPPGGDAGMMPPGEGGEGAKPPEGAGPGATAPGSPPAGEAASAEAIPASRTGSVHGPRTGSLNVNAPQSSPPSVDPPVGPYGPELPPGISGPTEIPRNRSHPEQSYDQRALQPKANKRRKRTRGGEEEDERRPLSKFERGPSSWKSSTNVTPEQVESQVRRLEAVHRHRPARHPMVSDLVKDPSFYRATNIHAYEDQIKTDWPEILAGGDKAKDSQRVLDDALMTYYHIYGVEPQW